MAPQPVVPLPTEPRVNIRLQDPAPAAPKQDPLDKNQPKKPFVEEPSKPPPGPDAPAPALPRYPGALPNAAEVFRFDDDRELNRRILTDLGRPLEEAVRVPPAKLVAADVTYKPKTSDYPPTQILLEPNYVVHRRLYYEERNAERYGWDAGLIQPLISTGYFYKDVLMAPHNLVAGGLRERYQTSAGKCLPGDPVPYNLYPPGFTPGGLVVGGGIITGLAFIFP